MITELYITDLTALLNSNISERTISASMSWSADGASQLTFDVLDENLNMLANNYFQVRRSVLYEQSTFEIASLEVNQGAGMSPVCKIEARTEKVQKMKRDKNPKVYGGISATDYARIVAAKFGLDFVGEPTSKKKAVVQSSTGKQQDSVWDVLQRSAQEAEFITFESDNTLYFASEAWLLGKWGNHKMTYPSVDSDPFMFIEVPSCRRSEDDPRTAEFRAILARPNATSLRPGMTVVLDGMFEFNGNYLITDVSYDLGVGDPVGIAARTVEKKT